MSDRDLSYLRKDIDNIDNRILKLLNKRMEIVLEVGKLKQKMGGAVYRPDRERAILDRLKSINKGPLKDQALNSIFKEIFSASRNLQQTERVAYLGPEGSFSYEAAHYRFGAMSKFLAKNSIKSVFKAVKSGHAIYGIVPIENRITGLIKETVDLLEISQLKIMDETSLPIHLVFATRCKEIGQVKSIYSKDIAFQECNDFLSAKGFRNARLISVRSTSEAARLAAGDNQGAAICSKTAARINNLPILHEDIEDFHNNATRFLILCDIENKPTGTDKTSILADFSNGQKNLTDLTGNLINAGINLIRIDSCPTKKGDDFTYRFYIEFAGHRHDPAVKTALVNYKGIIRWMGSYPWRI